MSEISTRLVGLTQLSARLDAMAPAVQGRLRIFFAAFTIRLRDQVKANILSRFHSAGPLYQGVQSEMTETSGVIEGSAFIDTVPYATIQEYGGRTPAHEILPKNASVLAFMAGPAGFSTGGGARGLIFAKKVNHPGSNIPERSYARLALVQLRSDFEGGIRGVVDEAVSASYAVAAE